MVQAVSQWMSFQEFLAWDPETRRYELHDGVVVEMQPTGPHEQVIGLLNRKLNVWLEQADLTYFIPNTAIVQPSGYDTGYRPDVLVIDTAALSQEPLWEKSSVITIESSVKLLIEVVSTNWPDDYARKFEDYEAMGISEYWIVDYKGLGGRRYIGVPKQPTITICNLEKGIYQTQLLRRGDILVSKELPGLELAADQIFKAGEGAAA
jgi:Uma2 family endonuclease